LKFLLVYITTIYRNHLIRGKGELELFAIVDKAFLGRGVFGVFSDARKANAFLEDTVEKDAPQCEIRQLSVIGSGAEGSGTVFAAYVYEKLYDITVLDGLYSDHRLARDVAGDNGLVVQFLIDMPGTKKIITDK
jgi:hypothetical protein